MDVVVQLVDQQSKNIRITPIEAKEVIQKKNMHNSAHTCYMFRLASADDLGGNSIVGFLVDGYNLQMCVCCTQMESLMPYFFVFSFNTLEDCSKSECRCKGTIQFQGLKNRLKNTKGQLKNWLLMLGSTTPASRTILAPRIWYARLVNGNVTFAT